MPTVLVFQGKSDFGSVNGMALALAKGFERLGRTAVVVDLRQPNHIQTIVGALRSGDVDLFFSLNGYGIPDAAGLDPVGFYGATNAPAMVFFVDHPVYHHPTICNRLPRVLASFPTAHHVDFCRRHVRGDMPLGFIPHGGNEPSAGVARPWAERDIDVLLSASLPGHPEGLRAGWAPQYGPQVAARLNAIVEAHRAAPSAPLHLAVLDVLGSPDLPAAAIYPYFAVVDCYLRAEVKLVTVTELAARGVRVTVRGPGWPPVAGCDMAGETPVSQVMPLMGRARVVLNPLPLYYECHERPLHAALHGAAAVAPAGSWMAGALDGGVLAVSPDTKAMADEIATALAGTELGERARLGNAVAAARHTWAHRAADILRFVEEAKMSVGW